VTIPDTIRIPCAGKNEVAKDSTTEPARTSREKGTLQYTSPQMSSKLKRKPEEIFKKKLPKLFGEKRRISGSGDPI